MNEFGDRTAREECGFDEDALFAYMDGDLDAGRVRAFDTHLETCAHCRKELAAYRGLENSLNTLTALDPAADFNAFVLARVMPARPALVPRARLLDAASRWFVGLPVPMRAYVSTAAVLAAVVLTFLTLYAQSVGGPGKLASRTIVHATQAGAGFVTDGARQVLVAVKVSDVFVRLAVTFRPIAHSLSLALNAVGPEFWLLSMLVSLLVLVGAVRLASGPAVGGGVHRVSFFC